MLPQPNTLVYPKKREGLTVAIKTRICNEIQLLQESQRMPDPKRNSDCAGASSGIGLDAFMSFSN